jgi:hypothetical protein
MFHGISGNQVTPPIVVIVGPAQLPLVWADGSRGCDPVGAFDQTKNIPADFADINAAWTAWQGDGIDDSWKVIVPAGSVNGPVTTLAKLVGGNMPTKCIVFESSTPLPRDRIVCTHGFQDNLPTSTDIGLRNPDCNGIGMTYQLGQTLFNVPNGSFTLANGAVINTADYNDVASMYAIECNVVNCTSVTTGPPDANGNGPNHFAFYDAEFRVNSTKTCCFPFAMENAGSTVQSLPTHYHIDRTWSHSFATDASAGTQAITDNWRMNCGVDCSLTNSYSSKSIRPGAEGHSLYYSDAGGLKIDHNVFEGMAINVIDGGQSHSVPGGVSGRDLEFRRNRFTYPLPWLGNGNAGGICGGASCVRKNCFEEKGVNRIIFDGNICENVDNSGGQNGTLTDFNNRACTPSACDNYVQTIQNVTITNTIYRHGCGGLLFDANSGNPGASGNSSSTPGRNFFIGNTLFYDISIANFNCQVSTNGSIYLGGTNHDFTVASAVRNSAGTIATITLAGGVGENQTGLVAGDPITVTGCTDPTFNVGPHPFVYALSVSGLVITYNNSGTANATSAGCSFNNGAGWPNFFMVDHVTAVADWDIEVGNNLTVPNATFPRNQTYTNSIFSGTRGFGTPGGANEGTNFENPFLDTTTLLVHHTVFSQRVAPVWQANTVYKLGQVVQPSGSPSHFYSAVKSGTSGASQPTFTGGTFDCVTDNTVIWQENGFRMATTGGLPSYTEYQVVNTPISPPTTLFFPQTDFTYGATADSTSIGFSGALNSPATGTNTCVSGTQVTGINTALDLTDWHGYQLHSSSAFKNRATDGKDLGVFIPDIDSAQTATQYVCKTPCGTGPKPD